MIYLFCQRGSEGAGDLTEALLGAGEKARRWKKVTPPSPLSSDDLWICWGQETPFKIPSKVRQFNNIMKLDKLRELIQLRASGVRTVPFSEEKKEGWLPRRRNHQKGMDLLHPPAHPDYWVEKLDLGDEWRVHVWGGDIIRLGHKEPLKWGAPHPWIRSHSAGWTLHYKGPWRQEKGKLDGIRTLAREAVHALGLDFGAVDMSRDKGGPLVLEVNRAPGLEPSSVKKYVEVIRGEV